MSEQGKPEGGGDRLDGRPIQGSLGQQIVGALIGAAVALLLSFVAQQLGWLEGSLVRYALWGGVIGGLVGGSDTLERAGSRVTRRDARWLNMAVGLLGMAVVFGLLFLLALGLSTLLRQISGG